MNSTRNSPESLPAGLSVSGSGRRFNAKPATTSLKPLLLPGLLLLVQAASGADPSLTIYNQNFAVVRDTVALDLKAGLNQVRFSGATAFLEPGSVMLRDPSSLHTFQVLEQNYRGDPISQEKLLEMNEGKTIDFEFTTSEGGQTRRQLVRGKVLRSGYYDPRWQGDGSYLAPGPQQPLVEINGSLRFGLPGLPLFPALDDTTILRPTLVWLIDAREAARFDAELSYVTGEMRWAADYNLVLPERGDTLDLIGWVTMSNDSGKSFERARIKLMAGDVNKIQPRRMARFTLMGGGMGGGGPTPPPVTEKSFDEYHLYTLEHPTTLLDREQKQVEFVHAADVTSTTAYIYDGASSDPNQEWNVVQAHTEPEYGIQGNKRVFVMREFANSATNHLGLPLPKGQVRLYRRDRDGRLEFTGENTVKHTPRDERIRLFTGNAFDLVGERQRTDFQTTLSGYATAIDPATGLPVPNPAPRQPPSIDESFEITLRNHKQERVVIRVVEHLYRWVNWKIADPSGPFAKTDAQTIEFRVELKPDEERKVKYTAHYSW